MSDEVIAFYSKEAQKWLPDGGQGSAVATPMEAKKRCDWLLFTEEDIKGKRVLNCGTFYPWDEMQFSHLAEEWVTIDIAEGVVSRQKELFSGTLPKVCFFNRDITSDYGDFLTWRFDIVLSFSTIDHISTADKRRQSIKNVHRMLKENGLFCISTEFADDDIAKDVTWVYDGMSSPVHLFSRGEFLALVEPYFHTETANVKSPEWSPGARQGFRLRKKA